MNALTAGSFYAELQHDGDVWISHSALNQPTIIIHKDQCMELAKLLMWQVISESWANNGEQEWMPNYNRPPYKVDYNTLPWEPE